MFGKFALGTMLKKFYGLVSERYGTDGNLQFHWGFDELPELDGVNHHVCVRLKDDKVQVFATLIKDGFMEWEQLL